MDRFWLITWTCYGHWLPGDARGFVSNVRDEKDNYVIRNIPGQPYDSNLPALENHVRERMTGEPVSLDTRDAAALIEQYRQTSRIRIWELQAASVMFNHTHLVVGVPGDPDPQFILDTYKSWATRVLKVHRPLPSYDSFWTAKGSKRKLPDERALQAAVIYVVRKQRNPLAVWFHSEWQDAMNEYDRLASRAP